MTGSDFFKRTTFSADYFSYDYTVSYECYQDFVLRMPLVTPTLMALTSTLISDWCAY